MRFSLFKSAKAQKGELCTYERYLELSNSEDLLKLCNQIASEDDKDKRGELKKNLPVITWQAYFENRRVNNEAEPSGLFMLDIDHVESHAKLYQEKIASQIKHLGIVYVGMTASRHGIRIVAKCLPTLSSIDECQKWLSSNLKIEYDESCKDWARCSFLVHDSYTFFMDANAIWQEEAAAGTLYSNAKNPSQVNSDMEKSLNEKTDTNEVDQREGLFGGQEDYKGIPLTQIAEEWLKANGGEVTTGERNTRLFKLALRMRYITDFNAATMLRVIPSYGLPETEMKELVHHAIQGTRAQSMPKDLVDIIYSIQARRELNEENFELPPIITDTDKMPFFPPVFRQWVEISPNDFKCAVALCLLPILGTLGSKLRAKYLDGQLHSPSFQVSLEAPQASGKSFLTKITKYNLAQIIDHDEEQRQAERDYDKKVREMKLLNIKVDAKNKDEVLGSRPETMVRFVPATMSITKLLLRMNAASGLHLFALSEEIDTITKAFKRGFSSYSDLLRVSFDNGLYGQDYASENSFSGMVPIYYNMLASGTPKAMCRFYPDVEDGLVSRVCFVTLPDQFGKKMPVWREFDATQKAIVDLGLVRLNEISIQGDEVQPDHIMKMDWLNKELQAWIISQQTEAVRENDRTRDIFCRRSAVVGFRAGMLAWFLYGEKRTPTIIRNVKAFAIWVANNMLNQHLLRFQVSSSNSNTIPWESVFLKLPDVFTRDEAEKALTSEGSDTPVKMALYKWRLNGLIEVVELKGKSKFSNTKTITFKKTGRR